PPLGHPCFPRPFDGLSPRRARVRVERRDLLRRHAGGSHERGLVEAGLRHPRLAVRASSSSSCSLIPSCNGPCWRRWFSRRSARCSASLSSPGAWLFSATPFPTPPWRVSRWVFGGD